MKKGLRRGESGRQRAVEHALGRSFDKAAAPPAADDCLDGETLAAWTSGALRSAEAVTVERHVADCARCQTLIATFARITPPEPVAEPLWRRWHLRWLVPLATAATAVAFWIAVPGDQMRFESEQPVADRFAAREAVPPAAAEPTAPLPSQPTVLAESSQAKESESARDADLLKQSQSEFRTAKPRESEAGERNVAPGGRLDERSLEARDQRAAVPEPNVAPTPTVPVAPVARPPGAASKPTAPAPAEAGPPPVALAAPPAPKTPREEARPASAARAAPSAAAPMPPPPPPAAANTLERDRLQERAASGAAHQVVARVDIVSPNSANRWRIVGGQQVERSTDSGATWTRVELTAANDLTAGSSPSATVVWIVGRGGTVFVTTDGTRFLRVPFVNSLDLMSVAATSDQAATVVAADGRAFRTTNRGTTWTEMR